MEERLIIKILKKLEYWEASSLKKIHRTSPTIFGEYLASRIIRIKKVMIRVTGHNEDWGRPQLPLTIQT